MYDVVVIGAGPAGSAAAYHASRAGLRVLIVDRLPFPRPKTCGDALTPRAVAAIRRIGVESLVGIPVRGIRLVHRETMTSTVETFPSWGDDSTGILVPREALDDSLLRRAREAGACFATAVARQLVREGSRVTGVIAETGSETLSIPARCVVVAIGSGNARFFRRNARSRSFPAVGLAGRVGLRGTADIGDHLEFHFPLRRDTEVLSAYGWVFPDGVASANVGVGVVRTERSGRIPLGRMVTEFVSSLVATDARFSRAELCSPMRAASIVGFPLLDNEPGLLTVGDAAGIAHPFTGEGIASALESGELAARAISRSVEEAHRFYEILLHDHFPQVHRLRPSIASMHSNPWIVLGRGWDAIFSSRAHTAKALKTSLWDAPPARSALDLIVHRPVQAALDVTRADLETATRRLPTLTGELVHAMLADSNSDVGWVTAFASLIRSAFSCQEPLFAEEGRKVLAALELMGIVGAAHCDLPQRSDSQPRAWGRKTLSLLIADSVSVEILAIALELSQPWRGFLTTLARQLFRRAATGQSDRSVPAHFAILDELLQAAALVGLPDDAREFREVATTVATALAALRTHPTQKHLAPDVLDALDRAPATLRTHLEELFSLAMRCRRDTARQDTGSTAPAIPDPSGLPQLIA